ncbi:uncharacterized protein [Henckelia pumila]|uniref:uncharacterized protein isoform X1 n=1 Tax=Henckelia pumila TaxID=405737 RepID=UPI003C6DE76D
MSECTDLPATKRRKKREVRSGSERSSDAATLGDIGTAISKSALMMAKAMQSREEADGRRHREVLGLHERRLQIEESKADIKRQGMSNLVDATSSQILFKLCFGFVFPALGFFFSYDIGATSGATISLQVTFNLSAVQLGLVLVKQYLGYFPMVQLLARVSPITRTDLKVDLIVTPEFVWKDRFHGIV